MNSEELVRTLQGIEKQMRIANIIKWLEVKSDMQPTKGNLQLEDLIRKLLEI